MGSRPGSARAEEIHTTPSPSVVAPRLQEGKRWEADSTPARTGGEESPRRGRARSQGSIRRRRPLNQGLEDAAHSVELLGVYLPLIRQYLREGRVDEAIRRLQHVALVWEREAVLGHFPFANELRRLDRLQRVVRRVLSLSGGDEKEDSVSELASVVAALDDAFTHFTYCTRSMFLIQ